MRTRARLIGRLLGFSLLAACRAAPNAEPSPTAASGLDVAGVDSTCAPCENFWGYANGAWLKQTAVATGPASDWSIVIGARVASQVEAIVDQAGRDAMTGRAAPGTPMHAVGTYYNACMDTVAVEALDLQPLRDTWRRIDAVATTAGLMRVLGELLYSDDIWIVAAAPAPDQRDARRAVPTIAFLGGLGLGDDREAYLRTDSSAQALRAHYAQYVSGMFALTGVEDTRARQDARTILELETALARAHVDLVTARDPRNGQNLVATNALPRLTPGVSWAEFFTGTHLPAVDTINARYPQSLVALDSLLTAIPLPAWKLLLQWKSLSAATPALPQRFRVARMQFEQTAYGRTPNRSRRSACLDDTRRVTSTLIGRAYVERHFSAAEKQHARAFGETMRRTLRDRLRTLEWMSPSTRREALAKLDSLDLKMGYPDRRQDDATPAFHPREYLGNRRAARAFSMDERWASLTSKFDRAAWRGSPVGSVAFYMPAYNDVTVPASVLQPPLWSPEGDAAVHFGSIGAMLGHEITHGFDVIGRQYDANGAVRDWWTAEDDAQYRRWANRIEAQFSAYPRDSTRFVDGRATVWENIADLGGVRLAYLAFQQALATGPRRLIDGYTPEQRFFLAYAQMHRPSGQLPNLPVPAKWRVNGPLANLPEFAAAWGCKAGDAMVRSDASRVLLW